MTDPKAKAEALGYAMHMISWADPERPSATVVSAWVADHDLADPAPPAF